jgi:hypothetical protein
MADTIQDLILDDIEETLSQVESIVTIAQGTFELYKVSRPAVGVIPDEEVTENMTHGPNDDAYLEKLRVAVRVVVDEGAERSRKTLGAIIGDVHKALLVDTKRGGFAADTVKIGTKWLFLDEHYPRAGADINFVITYATEEKDPSVSAFNS